MSKASIYANTVPLTFQGSDIRATVTTGGNCRIEVATVIDEQTMLKFAAWIIENFGETK